MAAIRDHRFSVAAMSCRRDSSGLIWRAARRWALEVHMNSKIAPVDLTTLQERVYRELREALYQGRLTAGGSLTIRGLSSALGTSEMPVREALKRLLAERILVQAPNRTFLIMPMTASRLHELIKIRITVEGMAVRLAAAAGSQALVAG